MFLFGYIDRDWRDNFWAEVGSMCAINQCLVLSVEIRKKQPLESKSARNFVLAKKTIPD